MENIKFIDISKLQEEAFGNLKNIIGLDSQNDVIKAEKQDSYTKDEIDDLLKDAEISADKLQNKIQINSANTDYVVTQPTVSGDSLVITDAMSDKNQYHTFGYDKSFTVINNGLLNASTPLYRGTNEYNCPQWDGNSIRFQFSAGYNVGVRLSIPYTYNGVKYVTHIDTTVSSPYKINMQFGEINDQNFVDYQSVPFKQSEIYKSFGANGTFIFKKNDVTQNYYDSESTYSNYIFPGDTIEMTIANFPLTFENGEIETPRFYILSNNFIFGDVPTESQSSDHPEHLSDYIRYSNDVKAYILTDKNTKFKTINGQQITGNGNIEISTDIDLSDYATKSELATKQDVITDLDSIRSGAAKGATALQSVPSGYATEQWVNEQGFLKEHQDISNLATKQELATKQDTLVSGENIKTVNGESLLGSSNMELATKAELNAKQDVITDLDSIRSGAAKGETALQEVPSEYATEQWVNEQGFLKEHQNISNLATKSELNEKQDVLVSGTNIKTVNGTSLLGSGNIEIEASSANVPTLQTTPKGTTSNYIYSTGIFDGYGVISDITNTIIYSTDKASISTWKRYWGEESSNSYQSWSIKGATTSEAGLMSSSDKTKLDGIDLSTKQDTLVSGTNIKTINGNSLLGSGDITIESGSVDLSDYYTKQQTNSLVNPKLSQVTLTQAEYDALQTKENNVLYIISDAEDLKFKTINGQQITGEGNITIDTDVDLSGYATKSELNTKQNIISDLETIRSGAAKGATALQSVPSTYALKTDIPDITTKQDVLVSGTNIKTVNGISLLGEGNITVSGADLSDYYTKAEIDAMIGGASSTITEINNLVV